MFSFLNTLEILPQKQVAFVAQTMRDAGLDAAIMLKAKAGMPGFISVNAWTADADPLCRTIATEVVCCEAHQAELRELLLKFCSEIRAAHRRGDAPSFDSTEIQSYSGVHPKMPLHERSAGGML